MLVEECSPVGFLSTGVCPWFWLVCVKERTGRLPSCAVCPGTFGDDLATESTIQEGGDPDIVIRNWPLVRRIGVRNCRPGYKLSREIGE